MARARGLGYFCFGLLLALTGCGTAATSIPTPSPSATVLRSTATSAPLNFESIGNAIGIGAYVLGERVDAGKAATLRITFQPVQLRVARRSDGSVEATSSVPWQAPNVAEMQFCTAFDAPCELAGKWLPFVREQDRQIETDWIGSRDFWLRAQFRSADGAIVRSFSTATNEMPKDSAEFSARINSVLDERTPLAAFPPKIQTLAAATRTAFPVTGSVKIENGRSIVGGKAGTTIDVSVEFAASSPFGAVKEMRVKDFRARHCANEAEINQAAWEPFASHRNYQVAVAINFTSFDVSAQYRDEKGNLSPIYCADIAVEGNP